MEAEEKQQVRQRITEWFIGFLCEAPKGYLHTISHSFTD